MSDRAQHRLDGERRHAARAVLEIEESSVACTVGAYHPSYMMPTVGIDADAGEEEAAAARIIIKVVVFMCRRWCRSEGGAGFAELTRQLTIVAFFGSSQGLKT